MLTVDYERLVVVGKLLDGKKNSHGFDAQEYDENSIQKLSLKYNLFKKNFKNKKAILTYLKKNKKIEFYAIFVCLGIKFDKEIFKLCNKIRFLISPTTGLDHINLKDLKIFSDKYCI